MKREELISGHTGPLEKNIQLFKNKYLELWRNADTEFPELETTYSQREQKENEKKSSHFFGEISRLINGYSDREKHQIKFANELKSSLKKSGKSILNITGINLEILLTKDFINTTRLFIENAKLLDDSIPLSKVYQALRNMWIMNSLQLYMDTGARFSQPIFAYSMLYPYTDNINDDISLTPDEKKSFNKKLKCWLEGENTKTKSKTERTIYSLLKRIEADFPRPSFPGVHQSIIGIYNAQIRSLYQHNGNGNLNETEVLDISFEKGGTSVLADGFLINGKMSFPQQLYSFGFGTFLQLLDDLQDMSEDRDNGHMTLFSMHAGKHNLDNYVNKTVNYMNDVLELNLGDGNGKFSDLKRLIQKSCFLMMMEAVGKNSRYFSSGYCKEAEKYIPFRFSHLSGLRERIREKIIAKRTHTPSLVTVTSFLSYLTK